MNFCKGCNRRPRKFSRDVLTCLNSTYKLLCDSDDYKKKLLCDFMQHNISNIILYPQ